MTNNPQTSLNYAYVRHHRKIKEKLVSIKHLVHQLITISFDTKAAVSGGERGFHSVHSN